MMRMKSGFFCALSMSLLFAISCADSPGTGDDDQGGQSTPTCGDGTCDSSEASSCPTDCGQSSGNNNSYTCGNGQCETTKGENAQNCGYDCNSNGSGSGSGSGSGQTSGSCPSDPNACFGCILDPTQCPSGLDANSCLQCILNGGGGGGSGFGSCEGGVPDGTCNAAAGEDSTTCPFDCM